MSRLYKRGNVYWYDFSFNGIRYRESTGKTKRREAEDFLDDKKDEIKNGKCLKVESINDCVVAELASKYADWVKHQKSYMNSKRFFIQEIVGTFGHLKVRDLSVLIVEQWQSNKREQSKPSTVNRITSCLKHMITKGKEWKLVSTETANEIKGIKRLKENNRRLRFLTIEECQTLTDCCQEHVKPIVTVALHTGMRRGEILNLKWEQVDLKHAFLLLRNTKNGERREVPINTTLEVLFNNVPRGHESEYVFTNKDGRPYSDIKHSFTTAVKKAGLVDFRFHDIRHTFASHLVMQGIDLTTIKELLGHKDITMTLRYAHLAPGHKKKAVNTLDKVMRKTEFEDLRHNYGTITEDQADNKSCNSLHNMVGATGFEPATS